MYQRGEASSGMICMRLMKNKQIYVINWDVFL
jgi:hypothetical protein